MESVADARVESCREGQKTSGISTSELNVILWRNFFKVVKRAWGVFGNYVLHRVGVKMGKLVAVEVKKS